MSCRFRRAFRKQLDALALIALTFIVFSSGTASAGSASLSWSAPTENTDGSTLTDLEGFRSYYRCSDDGPFVDFVTLPPTTTAHVVESLPDGVTCFFAVTAFSPGGESDLSNIASKTFPDAPPNPPTDLTVADEAVFAINQSENFVGLFSVGTIPVGTPCNGAMTVNGLYQVPKELATLVGADPGVIFAACAP